MGSGALILQPERKTGGRGEISSREGEGKTEGPQEGSMMLGGDTEGGAGTR